jgi:hypothetical protein
MTFRKAAIDKWDAARPKVVALVIGLVAGPLISNFAGWQVTAGAAQTQLRAGLIEQGALFCEQRARADIKDPAVLDWNARNELAKKWATVPGEALADSSIAYECARKLGA